MITCVVNKPSLHVQEAVKLLIRHSADVNARDKNWQTPLHVAAANKALRCAELIIPLLSSVNVSDRGGRTALHHAAVNGHTEVRHTHTHSHTPFVPTQKSNSTDVNAGLIQFLE